MAVFGRKAKAEAASAAPGSTSSQASDAQQALIDLAPLVAGSLDERSRLTFKRSGHKMTVVPQRDNTVVLHVPLSSAIVFSLRLPTVPAHGMEPRSDVHGMPIAWLADGQFAPSSWIADQANLDALAAIAVQP